MVERVFPDFCIAYCYAHLMQKILFPPLRTHYLNLASSSTLAGFCAAWLRLGISGVAFRGVLGVAGKGCKEKLQPQIDFVHGAISVGDSSFIKVSQTLLKHKDYPGMPEYKMKREKGNSQYAQCSSVLYSYQRSHKSR